MNGHDQAFKHLLQTFFPEFLEAFVPELRTDLDLKSIQFLDKELIRGKSGAQRTKVVDLVTRVKFRGQPGFILVHVEHSGQRKKDTTERLFLYAAGLIEGPACPVFVSRGVGMTVLPVRFRVRPEVSVIEFRRA